MVSGAIVAGRVARGAGGGVGVRRALGEAYQLHNDLLDLAEPAHAGCDLVQGKLHRLAAAGAGGDGRRRAARVRRAAGRPATANGHAVEMAEEIRRELHARGAAATRPT